MNIDIKWVVGAFAGTLLGLSTWVLISVVDLKEKTAAIQSELYMINEQFGIVYNHMNETMKK